MEMSEKMKKQAKAGRAAATVLLAAFFITSCGQGNKHQHIELKPEAIEKKQQAAPAPSAGKAVPLAFGKADFIERIHDYTKGGQWQYRYGKACVIDFYADWCRPCKILEPVLLEEAGRFGGQIDVIKINIDREKELASVFRVASIPMLLFCPADGSAPFAVNGVPSREELRLSLQKIIP
jgi:thioredoxin 1